MSESTTDTQGPQSAPRPLHGAAAAAARRKAEQEAKTQQQAGTQGAAPSPQAPQLIGGGAPPPAASSENPPPPPAGERGAPKPNRQRPQPSVQDYRPPVQRGEDPRVAAARMARQIKSAELLAQDERRGRAGRNPDGSRQRGNPRNPAQVQAAPRRVRRDPSYHPGVKPGHVGRWVRLTDHEGRRNDQRIYEFLDYGASVVRDPQTGQPVRGLCGLLIQMPVEVAAERTAERTLPGAEGRDQLHRNVRDMVADVNRDITRQHASADQAVRPYIGQGDEHRYQRGGAPVYRGELDNMDRAAGGDLGALGDTARNDLSDYDLVRGIVDDEEARHLQGGNRASARGGSGGGFRDDLDLPSFVR